MFVGETGLDEGASTYADWRQPTFRIPPTCRYCNGKFRVLTLSRLACCTLAYDLCKRSLAVLHLYIRSFDSS